MSFIENNFSPVGGFHGSNITGPNNGVAVYSYITSDSLATVKATGYFDELVSKVFRGDIIYVGSNQLDDDSSDNEYTIIYIGGTPPQQANVDTNPKDINAT